jgi:chaperonin cofactor prefoldin
MMNSRLDQAELLNEQVHADELQELLARLAATDALFSEPVPTIRDVAEATDASPLLIGRILSQMRGPDQVAELKGRMDGFEARLRELERRSSSPATPRWNHPPVPPDGFKPIDLNKLLSEAGVGASQPEPSWHVQKRLLDAVDDEVEDSMSLSWFAEDNIARVSRTVLAVLVCVLIVLIYLSRVFSSQAQNSGIDRPVPFPVELSTR